MCLGIEGIITIGLALISFCKRQVLCDRPFKCFEARLIRLIHKVTLTDRPETARWLTQAEKDMAIARVKSERVGQTQVLDKMDKTKLLRGILNPITLSTAAVFLLNNITVQGLAFFAPTIVKTIYPTASTVTQQLYTVPPYIVGAFFTVLIPLLSWKLDKRQIFMICSGPPVMAGYVMFLASEDKHVRYGATFLITIGAFMLGALTNAQVSANVVSDTARSSAIGTNVMVGNIGGLISTWGFLASDVSTLIFRLHFVPTTLFRNSNSDPLKKQALS